MIYSHFNENIKLFDNPPPPKDKNRFAFIFYVREDEQEVTKLKEYLEANGITTWLDKDQLLPGDKWRKKIKDAIQNGEYFIACFSKNYVGKKKAYMNEELKLAVEELRKMPASRKWFLPIKLNNCEIPDMDIGAGQSLSDLQWVNLSENWEVSTKRILEAIRGTS